MRTRSILLAATCAVAGLAGLVGLSPTADAAATSGEFSLLTYNVAGLPEPLSGSSPSTNSPVISPLLNAYDVVLLQENWQDYLDEERKAGIVGDEVPPQMYHHLVVRDADHPHRSTPKPHPNGVAPDRAPTGPPTISDGLNRLSRFAFDDDALVRVRWDTCHGELYTTGIEEGLKATGLDDAFDDHGLGQVNDRTDGGAADCGAEKGFSVARTELAPGMVVDVYNLHADAGSHRADQAARADNFRQLAIFIQEHSAGHAVILGGDTNLKTRGAGDKERPSDNFAWDGFLSTTGMTDACDAVGCTTPGRIDKVAFRSGGGVTLEPRNHAFQDDVFGDGDSDDSLSDHPALAVTFGWSTTG